MLAGKKSKSKLASKNAPGPNNDGRLFNTTRLKK